MILFPIFLILLIMHGLNMWFAVGIPLAIIVITPNTLVLFFQRISRVTSGCRYKFEVADISISFD